MLHRPELSFKLCKTGVLVTRSEACALILLVPTLVGLVVPASCWMQKLQRGLLSLACRHHIMELILGAVFQVCLGATSSPEVLLFKRFKDHWQFIDRANYETSLTNSDVSTSLEDVRNSLIEFAQKHIQEQQPRDDYREFLELALLFLGVVPERGVHFIAPGAMHHARWMSKVLYSLKIWMFKGQFRLTTKEERGLQELCIFIVRVYMRAWFTANLAATAPYNDMLLLQSMLSYSGINRAVSSAASNKFSKHLWYLSPELVGLAFFDDQVSAETKRRMVNSMNESGNEEPEDIKLISVDLESFNNRRLEDFVSPKSKRFFDMMELQTGFLDADPDEWTNHEDYRRSLETVRQIQVVNDHAERGVALIQEYSGILTRDEEQLQFLLQTVQQHRQSYPDTKKQTLSK